MEWGTYGDVTGHVRHTRQQIKSAQGSEHSVSSTARGETGRWEIRSQRVSWCMSSTEVTPHFLHSRGRTMAAGKWWVTQCGCHGVPRTLQVVHHRGRERNCCLTSTEASRPIRDGDEGEMGGQKSETSKQTQTKAAVDRRQNNRMLRQCPPGTAQQLPYHAIAVQTAMQNRVTKTM